MYPLSPAHDAVLNRSPSSRQYDIEYEVRKHTVHYTSGTTWNDDDDNNNNDGDTMSSPLVSNTSAMTTRSQAAESVAASSRPGSTLSGPSLSPAKSRRHSRVIAGTALSPLKILSRKRTSEEGLAPPEGMGPPPARSARKLSPPERRFPVKIGGGEEATTAARVRDRQVSLEEAMRTNSHLRRAIDIFEDDDEDEGVAASRPDTAMSGHGEAAAGGCNPDDTMTSTFSTFSAAPTLASYTNWRGQQSPAKLAALAGVPSSSRPGTRDESGNTTNLLMDFTDSLRHPARRTTASPDKKLPSSSMLPNSTAGAATPSKTTTTLIDFDIPPLPTPRSVPTISSRELESLKSGFLSEISSLKASLSGKEAEVGSLKAAVGDAEARVGKSTEALREQTALREQAVAERDDWERRGREVEEVLHRLRREREEAERKLEESEKRREAAEILHQEAESKIAGLRAGRETAEPKTAAASPRHTNKEVEIAVERVARELHTLYKGKHETKVTALKKSYEARWEKKVKELERRVQSLQEENAGLLRATTTTTTTTGGGDPDDTTLLAAAQANAEADKEQATRDRAAIRELHATVRRLEAVVASVQGDNGELRGLLERERVEKGELVQLAEEMMAMQQPQPQVGGGRTPGRQTMEVKTPGGKKQPVMPTTTTPGNARRGSVGKASGLRAPGSAYRGGGAGVAGAGAGLRMPGPRSGILSGIEKMGSHRGRGQ